MALQAEVRSTGRPSGEAARTSPKRGRAHRGEASAVPVVVVDPTWSNGRLRDSVMAQLVEWWVRTGGRIPGRRDAMMEMSPDALAWWSRWTGKGQDDAGRLSVAYEVAARSAPPRTPAGHREYWTMSLKRSWSEDYRGMVTPELGPSPDGFRLVREHERVRYPAELNEATRVLGIGRSTAYVRLQRGDRTLQEFLQGPDPLGALLAFLSAQAPARIPEQSREIVTALKAAGMKDNSARRLERRTRGLPPDERLRRIEAARGRIPAKRSQVGRRPIRYPLDWDIEDED